MPNFAEIGKLVLKILFFFDFSRWQPSAILDFLWHIQTIRSEYLGVNIILQNLVMIDAVVFII